MELLHYFIVYYNMYTAIGHYFDIVRRVLIIAFYKTKTPTKLHKDIRK